MLELEFVKIINKYNIGKYIDNELIAFGNVQLTYLITTSNSKYVFKKYGNRTTGSLLFESELIEFLSEKKFPCPKIIANNEGNYIGMVNNDPFMLFEFIEGEHINIPTENHTQQLIQMISKLHNLTAEFIPRYVEHRWNYSPKLCIKLAENEAKKIGSDSAFRKLDWLKLEINKLNLPDTLPKGICHCDFHFSNVLFKNGKIRALIDFDDANYTYQIFDIVALFDPFISVFKWDSWHHFDLDTNVLDFKKSRKILLDYSKYRPLSFEEKKHVFDVYKLLILFDSVWYFKRGVEIDFFEKRKINFINQLGREQFQKALFG